MGTEEGDEVKLRSQMCRPGDQITFSGQVADDFMSGSVFLGEYLAAQFSATRTPQQKER